MDYYASIHSESFTPSEFSWNSPEDVCPSSASTWAHQNQVNTEAVTAETSCHAQSVSPLIDSCAKAKVVAVMALDLLAFDGRLNHGRSNWACPFGDCKANFGDPKTLMRHVASCTHFTGSKVYCNTCDGHDCFPIRGDCRDDLGDDGVLHGEGGPAKKRGTIRKITSIISRSLPGSRPSSRASARTNTPSLVAGPQRHPPAMMQTPSPKGWSPVYSAEASERRHNVGSGSGAAVPQEMACTQRPAELPETPAQPQELPADGEFAPSYVAGGALSASPVEDLTMESRMTGLLPASNDPLSAEIPRARSVSATAAWLSSPALDTSRGHQLSQEFTQHTVSPLSASTVEGRMCSFPDASVSNYSMPCGNVNEIDHFLPLPGSSPHQGASSWPPSTPARSRAWQGSGDTLSSTFSSTNTLAPQHSEPQPWFDKGEKPGSGSPAAWPVPSPQRPVPLSGLPATDRQSEATEDLICPHCDFRPSGKSSSLRTYLKKHIAKHRAVKIPCPFCGKTISRMDNLKTHQRNSCPMARLAAPQASRPPLAIRGRQVRCDETMPPPSADERRARANKYLSQLPKGSMLSTYLQHPQNFEKLVCGLPTDPRDMGKYLEEWQRRFDAAKR